MLKVGSAAPDFSGTDQHGEQISLGSLLERGKLVLYFYPKDFTPVCTAQACTFRDAASDLADLGSNVVGVSGDSANSHERFGQKHKLPFSLLSDPDHRIIKAYDATWLFGRIRRVTYVIGADRKVLGAFHHELSAAKHLDDVKRLLRA
ncbi:MAG TPA: peroxiredoxin [Polyangiaceae bacterium]|jgi:peroxiredoxin Q/BCP|nr:peroxiredoxin [Polyangiaceae bacterium]